MLPENAPVVTLASIARRLGARMIDGLILSVGASAVLAVTGTDLFRSFSGDGPAWPVYLFVLVSVVYEIWLVSLTGQTIGKRLLSIQVVDADTADVPTLDQAGRRVAPTIIQLVPVVGFLGVLMYARAVWDPRRQGFHDRLAGTVVVDRRLAADGR